MVHYKSKHNSLTFLAKGELKSFSLGTYATDKKEEIEVLDKLPEVERMKVEKPEAETPENPEAETPAKTKNTRRKKKTEEE